MFEKLPQFWTKFKISVRLEHEFLGSRVGVFLTKGWRRLESKPALRRQDVPLRSDVRTQPCGSDRPKDPVGCAPTSSIHTICPIHKASFLILIAVRLASTCLRVAACRRSAPHAFMPESISLAYAAMASCIPQTGCRSSCKPRGNS